MKLSISPLRGDRRCSPPSPFLDNFRVADDPGLIVWWLKTKFRTATLVVTASTATPGVPFQVKKRNCGRSRRGSDATRVVQAFKHDPEVQVVLLQPRGARGDVRISSRIKVWPASLLRVRSLERLPSVAKLEQSQDLSKHRSRGNTSCQDPIVQPIDPRQPLFETTSLLP